MVDDLEEQLQGSLLHERVGVAKEASHACFSDLRKVCGHLQRPSLQILDDQLVDPLLDASNQLVIFTDIFAQKLEQ